LGGAFCRQIQNGSNIGGLLRRAGSDTGGMRRIGRCTVCSRSRLRSYVCMMTRNFS
jgi:hypothetical protein